MDKITVDMGSASMRGDTALHDHRPSRRPWVLALLVALATGVVTVVWLLAPGAYPYGHTDVVTIGFNHLIEHDAGVALVLIAAVIGTVLATIGLLSDAAPRWLLRVAFVGAVAEMLCFAFVLGDGSVMSALGYTVALTLPLGVVVILALVGRRWPPVGVMIVIVVVILGMVGLATGLLTTLGDGVAAYYGSFLSDPHGYYPRVAWSLGWLVGAAVWAWAAAASFRALRLADGAGQSPPSSGDARRWGRAVTIVAALCPVPYGFCRLMWLTPWPLGGNGMDEFMITQSLDIATRLRGFLFAPAAAVGVVLTFGLISRWGEVFPRWIPVFGGRVVPIKLAVVPGTLVAAVITLAAPVSFMGLIGGDHLLDFLLGLFLMPFPVWGPLLGAAVYAYWLRRTQESIAPNPEQAHH